MKGKKRMAKARVESIMARLRARVAEAEAERYARALVDTTRRYERGHMTRGTYRSHTESLWGTVRHLGLTDIVQRMVAKGGPAWR